MKIKNILILLFLLQFQQVISQQIPQFTHHLMNHFAYNPAVAGSKNCMDVTLAHRIQWSGFDGAPITTFGSFHTTIKKNRYDIANKQAIGLVVLNDSYGPFNRMKLKLAYAYHMKVKRKILLSMGMFVGLEFAHFDANKVTLINYNDPAIYNSGRKMLIPEITPGVFLQSDFWFAGATLQQALSKKIKAIGTEESKFNRHGTLLGGLNLKLAKSWKLVPSVLLKIIPSSPISADVNVLAIYKNNFTFGFSYRNQDAVAGLVKFSFANYFSVGYAYDFTLSDIKHGSFNTHEMVLGINPCGTKKPGKYACPTFN